MNMGKRVRNLFHQYLCSDEVYRLLLFNSLSMEGLYQAPNVSILSTGYVVPDLGHIYVIHANFPSLLDKAVKSKILCGKLYNFTPFANLLKWNLFGLLC